MNQNISHVPPVPSFGLTIPQLPLPARQALVSWYVHVLFSKKKKKSNNEYFGFYYFNHPRYL